MLKALKFTILAATSLVLAVPMSANAEEGFYGSGIPLKSAIGSIAPSGTEVILSDGVDGSSKASWSEEDGASWKKAVASAAKSAGYVAVVTDTKVVVSRPGDVIGSGAAKPEAKVAAKGDVAKPAKKPARSAADVKRPARKPAERAHRASRPSRDARVVVPETVSGGGFVFVPEEAPRVAAVDAKGSADGWRDYSKGSRPSVKAVAPVSTPWVVRGGDNLQSVLYQWAKRDGWTLHFESDHIYDLTSSAQFEGDFVSAVTQLLAAMRDVRPVVNAKFYEANKVVVVSNDFSDSVN